MKWQHGEMNMYYMLGAEGKLVDRSVVLALLGAPKQLPSQCICMTSQPLSAPKV